MKSNELQIDLGIIDLGAKALREYDMKGRITRSWEDLPSSDKRKWREKAACVLRAVRTTAS
jgi:hypothetical protein